jgi:hypothetical protein
MRSKAVRSLPVTAPRRSGLRSRWPGAWESSGERGGERVLRHGELSARAEGRR